MDLAVLLSQTRTTLNVREDKGKDHLSEPTEGTLLIRTERKRLKLSLSRAASLLDRRGGASQSMGGAKDQALSLCPQGSTTGWV